MSHKHPKKYIPYCLNCHHPLTEFDNFCPSCGQKPTDGKVTMHDLLHELTHSVFHVDGKLIATLRHIFIPGKLTDEFFKGHHKRYAHPVQLFLVLGAFFLFFLSLLSTKFEKKVRQQLELSHQKYEKRQLLSELDSTARQMPLYQKDPSVREAVDTLLLNTLTRIDGSKDDNNTLEGKAFKNTKAIVTKRLLIARLTFKRDSLLKIYPDTYESKIHSLTRELENLREDSVLIVKTFAKTQNTTIDSAKMTLKNDGLNRIAKKNAMISVTVNGRDISAEKGSPLALLNALEAEAQKEIPNLLADEIKDLSTINNSFSDGVLVGFERANEQDDIKEVASAKNKNPYQAINNDSIKVSGFMITKSDIMEMELTDIFEKYHVKSFWRRRLVGAVIMTQRAGDDKLHTLIGKSLWIIILSLLPSAALLWLLYRRQKRFFVEHLVWLLHVYCFVFLIFPLLFVGGYFKFIASILFMILIFVMSFLALKNYYKQGWGKTFVKYAIFSLGYFIITSVTFSVGAFLSFLFF